ncbi:ABC transporter permease [Segatella copri]|uniref:Efflux ABC transporter, permease protein n=1 Tax=Segatella copri DSM 18205 TaxID=537011 RepID=D1PE66_9BACT|nr:ABC transporter permease [Segatella copri]EFB34997.1 efflux ABC transporter, permease protein [Segatella copri DSM 18205]MCW4097024.1 ABC transporter permease [Segatella copri]MQP20455.1 ABC transporter permease [Segatella copri DSM 18205]UEA43476.1 ABC transporter permease [Segatella copri DSM 18205]UWP51914.1 ABC transporter permease [Segatella copri DSM 18205]
MRELIKEIWSTSKRNKLRTSLTGFAVAWGIFMLIFLLGAGNGLINAQLQQSTRFLANSMRVFPGETSKAYKGLKEGRSIMLNDKDILISNKTYGQYVDDVGGRLEQYNVNINYGDNYVASQSLVGVAPTHPKIDKTELIAGRFINEIDMKEQRKNVVLSRSQAKELCKDYRSLVGKNVKISNLNFQVVGIYKDDESRNNTEAFIAYSTIKTIYAKGDDAGSLEFTIKNLKTKEDNEQFEKNYRASINNNHQAAPDDERTIWLWNRYVDNIQMNQGIAIMQTALWIVGLFTLLSGIVGVSNIMLITVKERTREFGVRKAIGAKPWSILKLIITESIIITSFFGYIGMVCGVAANEIMDATIGHTTVDTGLFKAAMFVNPTVGIGTCIGATITIVIAGTIAGLIPAIKAARIRPIEALRAE